MLARGVERVVGVVTDYSKTTIAVMLVLSLVVGYGATSIPGPDQEELGSDSTEQQKLDYVNEHYRTGAENVTAVSVYVRDPGGNVLSKESLLATLRFQREVVGEESVGSTLADRRPYLDVSNLVALRLAGDPSAGLDEQIAALEAADEERVRETVATVLSPGSEALQLLPASYEPGSTEAEARQMVFTLRTDGGSESVADAEAAIYDHTEERSDGGDEYFTLSGPAVQEVNQQAITDTGELIGPIALLFIVVALAFAYRDVADVVVGMVGVVLTLVWMFGFIGWLDVPFGTAAIIAPILLIGLSIDYGIHVFMRYREERGPDEGIRAPMRRGLGALGVALTLVTVTTGIGFLSNLSNPLSAIRSLGVATALGVTAALVVFVTFVPALKIEVDGVLERVGFDRRKRALGTGGGRVGRFLAGGVTAARVSAAGVLVVALVLGAGGAAAWTGLDQELGSQPDQPPEWQQNLPEPFAMQEYEFLDRLEYVQDNFQRSGTDFTPAQVLVEGDVTDPATLQRMDRATTTLTESDVVYRRGDGSVPIITPLTVMRSVAGEDPEFAETFREADTDGDGVPDRNVREVYDALYEAAPDQAAQVIERRDGEYRSLRMAVPAKQSADFREVTRTMRDAAGTVEGDDEDVTATATGTNVIITVQVDILTDNVLLTLAVSLLAILVLLSAVYRLAEGSATLGAVTVLPIALVVTWVFLAMYLLDVPLTLFTALMLSLAIGLGVDYSIHVSERFAQELPEAATPADALETTVTGTGGALLGSTTTTVGAFSTLALSSFPELRQLGTMVAVSLVFSFVASVFVLPSLLTLWARYVGPGALDAVEVSPGEGTGE
ncbi:RND transporter [Halobacteriales archaeon QS_8_69_26]|nr:MAG: RND transporter [Halobacteriales archaeon QS_8_69_26]